MVVTTRSHSAPDASRSEEAACRCALSPFSSGTPEVEALSPLGPGTKDYESVNRRLRIPLLFTQLLEASREGGLIASFEAPEPALETDQTIQKRPTPSEQIGIDKPQVANKELSAAANMPRGVAEPLSPPVLPQPEHAKASHSEDECEMRSAGLANRGPPTQTPKGRKSLPAITLPAPRQSTPGTQRVVTPDTAIVNKRPDWMSRIMEKTDASFAIKCLKQVHQLQQQETSSKNFAGIWHWLQGDNSKDVTQMTGADLGMLAEQACSDRQRSGIFYALAAISLSEYFAGEVRKHPQSQAGNPKQAAEAVTRNILQPIRDKGYPIEKQQQCRKRLNTNLTRGRKWNLLTEQLGFGIVFGEIW
ncbi:hypothetical protein DL768_006731 [Monosporascus sp. mg162]|nr:hypothetical protein DL768_006731 [Monosporascus sp. mg162]